MATYARLPVAFVRGEGPWLWDDKGERYLDALSGIAVCGLGHAHPAVADAVCDQARTLVHTSNLFRIPNQERLAERLCRAADMDRVFFANSGAEANEAALKLARLHGHNRNIEQAAVVVVEGSFHGRTLATLSATGNRRVQAGFEPLVQGFVRAPFNDLEALYTIARNRPDVVAILLEPVLGEGGVRVPAPGYLEGVRALCDEFGWLMMLDEIQTGMGRSGRMFAYQRAGVLPDVATVAKGLGNGVPIGACMARGGAAEVLGPGRHGSTFGGNPLSSAAGLAVLDTLESGGLPERAAALGERMLHGLRSRLEGVAGVVEVRGLGLLLGIELDRPCGDLVQRALARRLLLNVTAGNVVRLLPPLVLSDELADEVVDTVATLVRDFLAANGAGGAHG